MASKQVLELIAAAHRDRATKLDLSGQNLTELPESIGDLIHLTHLYLKSNSLKSLPNSIGNLIEYLPESIGNLTELATLSIKGNKLTALPNSISNLAKLTILNLDGNQIKDFPVTIVDFPLLSDLSLDDNPIEDLSILQYIPSLQKVGLFGVDLPHRYWRKFSEWKAEWLLDERNAEVRRRLIDRLGYEKICAKLGAIAIDTWQEYTLLKIDNVEIVYQGWREAGREPMMLLKMTCPSTAHIHILRVPPDMTRAEDAIVWVNHGIHPSKFAIQT